MRVDTRGSVVTHRSPGTTRTLVAGVVALLVGLGGALAVGRLLSPAPTAARTASAQYLAPAARDPQPAPDFSLRDQAGQTVSLSALRGREVLLTFMDPQCITLCPIMGRQLGSVEASLPSGVRPVLLVVSVAPGRSASDVGTFVSHVSWQAGWHWLLGNQAELQAVWATYHVAVVAGATDVAHDETLYVIDPNGLMVAGYNAPLPVDEVASTIAKHSSR